MLICGRYNNIEKLRDDLMFAPNEIRKVVRWRISSAQRTQDLVNLFEAMSLLNIHIVGSRDYVYPSQLMSARLCGMAPQWITREMGLRDKYKQLWEKEYELE